MELSTTNRKALRSLVLMASMLFLAASAALAETKSPMTSVKTLLASKPKTKSVLELTVLAVTREHEKVTLKFRDGKGSTHRVRVEGPGSPKKFEASLKKLVGSKARVLAEKKVFVGSGLKRIGKRSRVTRSTPGLRIHKVRVLSAREVRGSRECAQKSFGS